MMIKIDVPVRFSAAMIFAAVMLFVPAAAATAADAPAAQIPPASAGSQGIAALVNDELISSYDVDQRLGMILSTAQQKPSGDELQRLRGQILRSLVDEKLQLQEAKKYKVAIEKEELDESFNRIASNFQMNPAQFTVYLKQNHTSRTSLEQQIKAEIAWQTLVNGRLRPQVAVSEEDVKAILAQMEANKGAFEYRVSEIYLIVDQPDQETAFREGVNRMVQQIRSGAPFEAYARQFSQASTAAAGGDKGWLTADQFSPELADVISRMEVGTVSDPIRTAGGYYVLSLLDRRKVLSADPLDTKLKITQIFYRYPEKTDQQLIVRMVNDLSAKSTRISSCDSLEAFGKDTNASAVRDAGMVKLRDFPPGMRGDLAQIDAGRASRAYPSQDGVRIFAICGREEAEVEKPTLEQIQERLEDERLSMMSRRYLRDLRRDAVIDYK